MIHLDNISKSYRVGPGARRVVLEGVSTVFPTGRSIGILGLNGAGKSTLIRLIAGVEPPDTGVIRKDVRLSWPIGFSGGMHRQMTGRENARFIARIYGADPRKIVSFAEEFSELGVYFDMQVKTYSSGMKARLAFAVSMAADFDCYLVDEVIAVGDRRFNARYRQAFRERLRNASVIIVSHQPSTIRRDCDMGAVLHNGNLTLYDTVDQALRAYQRNAND